MIKVYARDRSRLAKHAVTGVPDECANVYAPNRDLYRVFRFLKVFPLLRSSEPHAELHTSSTQLYATSGYCRGTESAISTHARDAVYTQGAQLKCGYCERWWFTNRHACKCNALFNYERKKKSLHLFRVYDDNQQSSRTRVHTVHRTHCTK